MEPISSFGYWVRRRRKALDLTQDSLAGLVGCSLSMLRKIERDERRPSEQLAELLARHLAIAEQERPAFLRMARHEYVADMPMPSQVEVVPGFLQEGSERGAGGQDMPFVERERELAQLEMYLSQALMGRRQLVFVAGEAGRGKTMLLRAFGRRAAQQHAELLVTSGSSEAHAGAGDLLQPFRDVLALLCGDVENWWATGRISREQARRLWRFAPTAIETVLAQGPQLIDTLVSANTIMARLQKDPQTAPALVTRLIDVRQKRESRAGDDAGQQEQLFEAFARVVRQVTAARPLILLLDDLHWADVSTISLLTHLAPRTNSSPLLIVAGYRPEDVIARAMTAVDKEDGEPRLLQTFLSESKRRYGDVWIDLDAQSDAEGRAFVDALIDAEPNRLGEAFRAELARRTEAHPLFVVELLRELQSYKGIVRDSDGAWVEAPSLSWAGLPARVEGVIEKRIGRLRPKLREMLTVASVEGETFTAEVLAQVQGVEVRQILRALSQELGRQHRLVEEQGTRMLEAQRLSQYRLRHSLFQQYLYDKLGEAERQYLHEAVGRALESLLAGNAEEAAVHARQLARHFELAGQWHKAISYLKKGCTWAEQLAAYEEGAAFLQRGLTLNRRLAETHARDEQRCELLLALADMQWKAGRGDEALQTLAELAAEARALASAQYLARAALREDNVRWRLNLERHRVLPLLDEALAMHAGEPTPLQARLLLTKTRALEGAQSREQLLETAEHAVAVARRLERSEILFDALRVKVLVDRRPAALAMRETALDEMIRLAEARNDIERVADALMLRMHHLLELAAIDEVAAVTSRFEELAEELQQPFYLYGVAAYKVMLALLAGEYAQAEGHAHAALALADQMRIPHLDGMYGLHMFSIRREQGRLGEVLPAIKFFVEHNPLELTWQPGLALIYSDLGMVDEAREVFERLAGDDFGALPRDSLWLTCIAYLAEVCAELGDGGTAALLYQKLWPYRELTLVVGHAVACYGAVARYLGVLATVQGEWETAEGHFEQALVLNRQLRAKPYVAHTQQQYAAMLLTRNEAADRQRALGLLAEAEQTAHTLGMALLSKRIEKLRSAA